MRRTRRLVVSWPGWAVLAALMIYTSVVSRSNVQLAYADHQIPFFSIEGFHPVGIDFGFRLNVPGLPNEPRMYVTSPLVGNPRQLQQRDADATEFSLRATLLSRPNNVNSFADNLAVIPAVLGTQEGQTTAGGFTPNDILVTQRLKVFRISGAGTGSVTPTLLTTVPPTSTQCTSSNSRIAVDRWTLQFGGRAIFTCTGFESETENEVTEIWLIGLSGGEVNMTKFKTLGFRATGRVAITSPNFSGCGGCLALVADNSLNVTLINGAGTVVTIATGLTATLGPRNAITVPTRVYGFGSFGGCLFGTVPSQSAILEFPCAAPSPPTVFANTSAGDLLIFTPSGSGTVVRVKASDRSILQVHSNAGVYRDLAFSPLRRVKMVVVQPSVANPNLGPRGHIVFRFPPSPGFDPATDVNRASLKFGATGDENSVFKCEAVMGDGTLQCLADARVANCNGPILCIVTGFTVNQTGFDGGI